MAPAEALLSAELNAALAIEALFCLFLFFFNFSCGFKAHSGREILLTNYISDEQHPPGQCMLCQEYEMLASM